MVDVMNLDEYRELVSTVMRNSSAQDTSVLRVFDNFGIDHAKVVLSTMLSEARMSIKIFAYNVSADAFDVSLLQSFLARAPEGTVRVLVANKDVMSDRSSALYLRPELISSRFMVGCHNSPGPHFTVVDDFHVRIETSHAERKAVVGFGERVLAAQAAGVFEKLWAGRSAIDDLSL